MAAKRRKDKDSSDVWGFAASGKGHSELTKRLLACSNNQEKAELVAAYLDELGWEVGDLSIHIEASMGEKRLEVMYPPQGSPHVRFYRSHAHRGRTLANISAALTVLEESNGNGNGNSK